MAALDFSGEDVHLFHAIGKIVPVVTNSYDYLIDVINRIEKMPFLMPK